MANQRGTADTLEQHQHEVCSAFARAAVAMRDAANTAENFSNWFSRVNNLQNVPVPPMFNGAASLSFVPTYGGPQHQYPAQGPIPEETSKKRKAADEPEGKKKRITKKPRDVNAPKRPPSPYLLFQNEIRKTIQAQHPDTPYGQLLGEIAKIWKDMSPEQKAPYQASQALLKAKYEQEKADYESSPVKAAEADAPTDKASTAAPVVSKSAAAVPPAASDDSSDESTEPSSSGDGEEDEEEPVPVPEPPRKKSKKEVVKAPTPPPAKAGKKKEKSVEGKKKKKADT